MSERKVTFGRIFWPSFWAALIVSVLGVLVWVVVIGIFARSFEPKGLDLKENSVLHMQLKGEIAEKGSSEFNPGSFTMNSSMGLSSIIHGLEVAKTDDKIKGVFIEIDDVTCGWAAAKEIRDAINDFEECGKFVVAYNSGEVVSTLEYYLASAANENYGFPTSNVQFVGLGGEMMYFKKTMEMLDVEVTAIRGTGNDFKSAVEPFFLESMSDSARVQMERYVASMWEDMRNEIAKDRKVSAKELNDIAEEVKVITVEDAVKHKLMDATKFRDEVLKVIADKINLKDDEKLNLFAFNKYAKKKFYQDQVLIKEDNPNIAVILAEGGVAKSGDGLTSDDICKLFKEARENESIKTVVFRINSPGGSALASEEIWREVKLTNDKKTVIVSMGNVAASGGYYIATPAARIFAEPTTITGSIGVFGMFPYTGNMFENKLGITFDRVATNKHTVLTTNRKLTEEELAMIQDQVDDIYTQFKQRVADGRGMTKNQVEVVARGRVWTGTDALRIGLVDELGGLKDAINYAAKEANIKDQKVLYYPHVKEDKFGELLEQLEEKNATIKMSNSGLPADLVEYYAKIKEFEHMHGIQMRMPFELVIK